MVKRKYEVHGTDLNGDLWVVATERREVADSIAEQFRGEGYTDVLIVEN